MRFGPKAQGSNSLTWCWRMRKEPRGFVGPKGRPMLGVPLETNPGIIYVRVSLDVIELLVYWP